MVWRVPIALLAASLCALAGRVHATEFTVGVAASDDPSLSSPVSRDSALTVGRVEAMVRAAIERAGGLAAVIPDTARLVVIKPNIGVVKASGTGVVTDARVVRAVALAVHEAAPGARILIAEGPGGWVSPEHADSTVHNPPGWPTVDGFEAAGHRATVAELRQAGVDIDCFDLNFDEVARRKPPTGGLSMDEYALAATILEADAWINCPVAKTHGSKITCCLKNQFGLFPGSVYGWHKSRGTPNHRGIPHAPRVMDETFVDLLSLTEPDFNVVDMIAGTEGGAFEGRPKRSNLIVAGADAIATDLVVARLMGFNPDDFEYADLGVQHGIGPGRIDAVTVRGDRLDRLASRFRKASMDYTSEWAEHAGYGMGPRYWTLLGPLAKDHSFASAQAVAPTPGRDGWSEVVRFGDDRIDLDKYFDDPTHCAVYAFTRFTMARSDSVRLWIGSDEGLDVWIDGVRVHHFEGRRRHVLGSHREPYYLAAGEHSLLVRAEQSRGRFDFSVNICEPIDDPFYAGNRYPGVRYYVTAAGNRAQTQVTADHIREDWIVEPIFASTLSQLDPIEAERTAPGTLTVEGTPQLAPTFIQAAAGVSGVSPELFDSVTAVTVSEAPFHFAKQWDGGWWLRHGPNPDRILAWLGLEYDVRAGFGHRETAKAIRGWLALGRTPIVGFGRREWSSVTGARQAGDGIDLLHAGPDSLGWRETGGDWWSTLPGGRWYNCPVLVVERTARAPALTAAALVDSVAALAHAMGTRRWVEESMAWGPRRIPAGLAAWDGWVLTWRDVPLDRAGLEADGRWRSNLSSLRGSLQYLADQRRLAAGYFRHAAQELAADGRHARLTEAAAGYGQVADALDSLVGDLPATTSGAWSDEDLLALERLPRQRDAWERARAGERQALLALGRMLDLGELPLIVDPLRNRDRGHRVLSWRAELSSGVYDLELTGEQMRFEHLFGRLPEGETSQIHAAVPTDEGWQLAVEGIQGAGRYEILQQPTAANGWTAVMRIDDASTWQNTTELVLWAVPDL